MEMGKDLEVIQTESLGFLAIAGDAKVQLTPPWSPPPAATASLLSIASRRGLVATAGPDAIYLASTESVRQAFQSEKTGDTEFRPFEAQAKIPMPMRISHLVFTPDEQYLVLSAEQGGGLAVYETQTLLQGSSQAAFEVSTSGESVKALIPNPMPELAELCAVVTNNGNLLMANFKEKSLINGSNGPVIRNQVTSAAWSTKGKQVVAGMADGTVVQMTPDGTEKAHIPKPDALGDSHVASIAWLENNVFLVVHTENTGAPPSSQYHIITRRVPPGQAPSFEFRKMLDPVDPFENSEAPQYTILRLRDYPPNIQDMLFVASTAHDGMGLLTRSKVPLANDVPAEDITSVFTTTEFTDDSNRAELPSDPTDYSSTYPIGVSLDLSSKDNVYRPIPSDEEIEQSPGPLPALWALNTIGVLSAWWVVYNDAIREGKIYPGMAAAEGQAAAQPAAPATTSAFGSQPTSSPSSGSSAFGTTALALAPSSIGTSNAFGGAAAATSFGTPSFGTSASGYKTATPAFGQSGGLGITNSPWATASTGAASSALGPHGFSGSAAPASAGSTGGKVFGSGTPAVAPTTGPGFVSFANKGGFASLGGNNSSGSIFSQPSTSSPFGSNTSGQSVFGKPANTPEVSMGSNTSFPPASSPAKEGSAFGSTHFVLETTFKADPASANDNEKPSGGGGMGLGGFGLSLDDAASKPADPQTSSKDEDMDAPTPAEQEKPESIFGQPQGSTTPTSTPAPNKFISTGSTATKPNPFSAQPSTSNAFAAPTANASLFASKNDTEKSKPGPSPSPNPFGSAFGNKPNPSASNDEPNPFALKDSAEKAAEAPLPPDAMSKAAYPFGESSASSIASAKSIEAFKKSADKPSEPTGDAPLPPNFLSQPKEKPQTDQEATSQPLPEEESSTPEEAPLPPDFTKPQTDSKSSLFGSNQPPAVPDSGEDNLEEPGSEEDEGEDEEAEGGSEGSGIDVANDLSPSSTAAGNTPGITPGGSFAGMAGSTYSVVSRPDAARPDAAQAPRPSLFGEISRNGPVFPKPESTSPRSPSPFRNSATQNMLPGEGSRSVGAPSTASQFLGGSRPQSSEYGSKTISTRLQAQEDPNVALQKQAQKKQAEQETQTLEDDEFEVVQNMLGGEIEPTLDIGEFNAFNSVPADAHASTVAAQVEALYRDMNGMLVTLGLNARALAGFIKGHEDLRNGDQKTKDDLTNPDDWVLCEAKDLTHVLDDELAPELEAGRLQDLDDTWDTCQGLVREIPKLRAKHQDIKRILGSILDPEQALTARSLPLSAEQAAQQNELRQTYAKMTKLMADAEGALTMLKAKLASLAGTSGKAAAVPTVDAVMRTILRMTSAAEKRSGDLDVLERQMRKVRLSGSAAPSSREASPSVTATPTPNSKKQSPLLLSGSVQTPPPRRSLMSSVGSLNGSAGRATPTPTLTPTPRKKLSGFTEEDKVAVRTKMQKRQAVLDRLRAKLSGPKMSKYGDRK
ncbi:hypothetical protein VM1G_02606 [Cytospora mali]|uniref:Nucleoporin Nup159/Nup146 N-terminal domain-containing protein n=1 Tax=Cytospora mali TaxID=578113 RepID=A0A194VUM6_CYTMA|nr:hypothetical protein VM1G_02606 [Valsa mali]